MRIGQDGENCPAWPLVAKCPSNFARSPAGVVGAEHPRSCFFAVAVFLPEGHNVLRLIRVELGSGEVEVLATSLLDSELYPTELFAELYHERWGHEEGYKHLKIHAELQNWTGKQLHTVFQDLHAKLLTLNLVQPGGNDGPVCCCHCAC